MEVPRDKITHEMHLMQWTPIIRKCRGSDIPVKSWCLENNVNKKQFYYWQCCVREKVNNTLVKTEFHTQLSFVQPPFPIDNLRNISPFATNIIICIGNMVLESPILLQKSCFLKLWRWWLMLNDTSSFEKIHIACGYSDLQRGIDGFDCMIHQRFKLIHLSPVFFCCSAEEGLTV